MYVMYHGSTSEKGTDDVPEASRKEKPRKSYGSVGQQRVESCTVFCVYGSAFFVSNVGIIIVFTRL